MPYATAVRIRNGLFETGLRRVRRLPVPVISVGNLTTGGTGKTPIVAMIASTLQNAGLRPAILSRGYRSDSSGINDEKRVLDQLCPGVPHVQNPDRFAGGMSLVTEHQPDVIVMDDGLQHRQLHRDLNIILMDACNPFGYGFLLPRGLLRESVSGLWRADVVLITRSDLVPESELKQLESKIAAVAPGMQIMRTVFAPVALRNAESPPQTLSAIGEQRVFLMSGIGHPEAFAATCRTIGMTIVGHSVFADHHHYRDEDLKSVREAARSAGADTIVTTQKDLVKLPSSAADFHALEIAARFVSDQQQTEFTELLLRTVRESGGSRAS